MRSLFNIFTRLRVRLAVVIAIALAPAGVLAIVQAINATEALTQRQTAAIEAQVLSAVDVQRATLIEMREALRSAAFETDRVLEAEPNCLPRFNSMKAEFPWLLNLMILDENGQSRCSTGMAVDVGGLPEWQRFTSDPAYMLSTLRVGRSSGKRVLVAYYPLPTPRADATAVGMSIDADQFEGISAVSNANINVALIDKEGTVISADDIGDASWLPTNRSDFHIFGDRQITTVDSTGAFRSYFVFSLAEGHLWAVVNSEPASFLDNVLSVAGLSILAPIAIWLIAVIVAYFAIDILVTRHVAELRRAAVRIGAGNLDVPLHGMADAPSEIRALGASITAMGQKIGDREAELKATLEVQRRLLLEIHHRVKNNLQTISSLMNLEGARVKSAEGRAVISTIQARIHSLAMVHQNLYAAENLEEVALDQLTRDIASHLEESLAPEGEENITAVELEPLVAPTVLATPIALFMSEALGNAFKHAAQPPDIRLSLRQEGGLICLSVSNAVKADAPEEREGLGSDLMRGFAKQLGGVFEAKVDEGRFFVSLKVPQNRDTSLFSVRKP